MRRLILAGALVLLITAPAGADDFDRRGWYVGAGGGAAWDFLDDAVQDITGGLVNTAPTGSAHVRGGYRLLSWLALEGMYEGAYGYDTTLGGVSVASLDTHSLLANLKLILPIWRTQPYLVVGVGAQQHTATGNPGFEFLDNSRWDLVVRPAVGLDLYITKRWLINAELAPSVSFRRWNVIPSETTDNVSLILSGGIQYRF